SATAGQDYVTATGSVTMLDNQASVSFTVPIINDNSGEGPETVRLSLSNLRASGTTAFLAGPTSTLTIVDDDTTVRFASASFSAAENATNAVITVVRGGVTNGAVSVDFRTVPNGGSAVEGLDYLGTTGTLSWAAGDGVPKSFLVPIIDNTGVNPNKTVLLALTNLVGAGAFLESP